ncbi:MAG: M48 family metalloprotease [Chloroflexi bacterium]|nr:M48 family metalloprotease [Chloroflexota bacterium]
MWEQIRSNRIKSVILVLFMGTLLFLVGYFVGVLIDNPIAGLLIAFIIWFFLNLIAYFQGDSILLSVAHARKITSDDHARLYNVVEEIKIASGLEKMPDIYIIDDPALNAFATGRDQNHAAVAITSGLLDKLNRDELQGVIAHEISHIKNRDVLLMTIASITMGAIVMISWYVSRAFLYSSMTGGSRRKSSGGGSGGGAIIIMAVGLVLMILAPIFAQLIYFAISRRREYLADASGALYTRYPEGLASALEKIAGSGLKVQNANKATAPMYISNPFKTNEEATDLSSTHPPISKRIRILRSMGGGASLSDYDRAYRSEFGSGKGVIPQSAVAVASPVSTLKPKVEEVGSSNKERARETSNLLWKFSNHKLINCQCGAKLRVPPDYKGTEIRCPHCGTIHYVKK